MSAFGALDREFEELKQRVAQLEALIRGGGLRSVGQPPRTAYKPSEVARMIGKSPRTVREMIKDGRIQADDMGGWYSVPRSEVERLSGRAS